MQLIIVLAFLHMRGMVRTVRGFIIFVYLLKILFILNFLVGSYCWQLLNHKKINVLILGRALDTMTRVSGVPRSMVTMN